MLRPACSRAGQQLDLGMAHTCWVMPPGFPVQWGSCLPSYGCAWQRLSAAPLGQHPPCSPSLPLCLPAFWHGGLASAPHRCPSQRPAPGGGSRAPGGGSRAPGGAQPVHHLPPVPLSPAALWARRGPCRASCGASGCPLPPAAWCHCCLQGEHSVTVPPTAQQPQSRVCSGQPLPRSLSQGPSTHLCSLSSWHTVMDCGAPTPPRSSTSADRVWGLEHPTALQPLVGRIRPGGSREILTESLRHLPHSGSCYLGPSSPREQCLQLKQNTETMHYSGIKNHREA